MNLWKSLTTAALLSIALVACSGEDDGTQSGNNEACGEGENCTNNCDLEPDSCNMSCAAGSTCKATCQDGQSCNFACHGTADCTFDCTAGTCNTSGDSDSCTCTGDCIGTCGGIAYPDGGTSGTGGTGGSTGTGGTAGSAGTGTDPDCMAECGAPTDPGYAECVAACAQ